MIKVWEQPVNGGVTHAAGFRAGAARCGLKTAGDDLALIVCDGPASAAGVFTTNQVKASCVTWSKAVIDAGGARAVLCNAGNANACNGPRGDEDTRSMAALAAGAAGVPAESVLVASTGIIGHPMPMEKIQAGVPAVAAALGSGPETDMAVARAIMTTDLVHKLTAATVESDHWSGPVRFGGVCKGSGMIAPNMATMLCFLTTDAAVPQELLQNALATATARTFNRMTVDGDTSTNDMVLLLASGAGGVQIGGGAAYDDFAAALERVCLALAKEVARDGEGATKLVEVAVRGARTEADAERIARTVAESPLVKTALFGCDPNWGRILMAAGRAGVPFNPTTLTVSLGSILVFEGGTGVAFDADAAHEYLKNPEVRIVLQFSAGDGKASVWTCDYSYDYIKINAEYHT